MAVKEWGSNYPTSQDTGANGSDQQPTLVNGVDVTRASQLHAIRNKAHALALAVGDDSDAPAGSLRARVTALEGSTSSFDPDAIHGNVADEIGAITQKLTDNADDYVLIEDAADGWNKKRVKVRDLAPSYRTRLHSAWTEDEYTTGSPGDWATLGSQFVFYVHDHVPYANWVFAIESKFNGAYAASYDMRIKLSDNVVTTYQAVQLLALTYTSYTLSVAMVARSGVPTNTLIYGELQARCADTESAVTARFRDFTGLTAY